MTKTTPSEPTANEAQKDAVETSSNDVKPKVQSSLASDKLQDKAPTKAQDKKTPGVDEKEEKSSERQVEDLSEAKEKEATDSSKKETKSGSLQQKLADEKARVLGSMRQSSEDKAASDKDSQPEKVASGVQAHKANMMASFKEMADKRRVQDTAADDKPQAKKEDKKKYPFGVKPNVTAKKPVKASKKETPEPAEEAKPQRLDEPPEFSASIRFGAAEDQPDSKDESKAEKASMSQSAGKEDKKNDPLSKPPMFGTALESDKADDDKKPAAFSFSMDSKEADEPKDEPVKPFKFGISTEPKKAPLMEVDDDDLEEMEAEVPEPVLDLNAESPELAAQKERFRAALVEQEQIQKDKEETIKKYAKKGADSLLNIKPPEPVKDPFADFLQDSKKHQEEAPPLMPAKSDNEKVDSVDAPLARFIHEKSLAQEAGDAPVAEASDDEKKAAPSEEEAAPVEAAAPEEKSAPDQTIRYVPSRQVVQASPRRRVVEQRRTPSMNQMNEAYLRQINDGSPPSYDSVPYKSQKVIVPSDYRDIPVESLGTGVFNMLGDAVEGVVNFATGKGKEPEDNKKPGKVVTGVRGVLSGTGQVIKGGGNIALGALGIVGSPLVYVARAICRTGALSDAKNRKKDS
ncbi:hypothetical protein ACQZV8_09055 [Magnetococcales bacterium HHB-1]